MAHSSWNPALFCSAFSIVSRRAWYLIHVLPDQSSEAAYPRHVVGSPSDRYKVFELSIGLGLRCSCPASLDGPRRSRSDRRHTTAWCVDRPQGGSSSGRLEKMQKDVVGFRPAVGDLVGQMDPSGRLTDHRILPCKQPW